MSATDIIAGTVTDEGTLELDRQITLPPGPVRVTLESISPGENIWTVLERIRQKRNEMGLPGRSREEIDAQLRMLRSEWDQA